MAVKYVGKGSLPGIPARDLTDEEAAKFGVKYLVSTGLYEEVKKPYYKKAVPEDNGEE